MRAYIVILYTNDLSRLHIFSAKYLPLVQSAGNRHYLVFLQGNTPLSNAFENPDLEIFSCFPDLRKRLSVSPFLLSDVIVVIDSQSVQNEGDGKQLRDIIVEFPDVKFVVWAEDNSEKDKFKKYIFPLDPDAEEIGGKTNGHFLNSCIDIIEEAYASPNVENVLTCLQKELESDETLKDESKSLLKQTWDSWKKDRIAQDENNNQNEPQFIDYIPILYVMLLKYLAKSSVLFDLIFFPRIGSDNVIVDLISGYDSLFDASNFRYTCKQWRYADLNIRRRNFKWMQESRKDHLALCVEEERGQNRYSSYCLYANGFRVLPITSASELRQFCRFDIITDVIVRDYDLQFPDPPESIKEDPSLRPIDAIRGFFSNGATVSNSPYWTKFDQVPVYYISKGDPGKVQIINATSNQVRVRANTSTLLLPGIVKPVNGIHVPFESLNEVKMRYRTVYKGDRPSINTERMNHNHGVPLDIYESVQSIVDRAGQYYNNGKYIHAAVLANEAMEIMNGFHQSLMLRAYHLYAIAENAVSMNAIGVNDTELRNDTLIRIKKIARDIDWILQMRKDGEGEKQSRNVLNQIYSDCRNFCYNKEHFLSEDAFVSAMGHLNDGIDVFSFVAQISVFEWKWIKRIHRLLFKHQWFMLPHWKDRHPYKCNN